MKSFARWNTSYFIIFILKLFWQITNVKVKQEEKKLCKINNKKKVLLKYYKNKKKFKARALT